MSRTIQATQFDRKTRMFEGKAWKPATLYQSDRKDCIVVEFRDQNGRVFDRRPLIPA
jgi:hypothetical protein